MRYIETFHEGNHISDIYLCKTKQIQLTKTGKEYGNLILQDKTGTIEAKIWDLSSPGVGEFDAMDYVHIEADVTLFQNANQLNVRRIRTARERESMWRRIICLFQKKRLERCMRSCWDLCAV